MSLLREIGEGLPLEMRFGGWAASCHTNTNARVLAQAAILAAVRHPEWAMAIVEELGEGEPAYFANLWADRLVQGAFVEIVR